MIPFIDLATQQKRLRAEIDRRLARVLDHGAYIMGPEVAELEAELASWADCREVVSCSSGTDALLLALMALGLKPGEGVIVPSFTFTASAEVMPMLGAIPVFAEVEEDSFNLDPAGLPAAMAAAEQAGVKVVGIMAVGLFGQPADMDGLAGFARQHNLWLVDDAAQSFGSSWAGRKTGSLADISCTSFFPAKPLGCYGDGGACFTDNADYAALMRSVRVHGQGQDKYHNDRIGMTARLDSMQAAVLLAKLGIFADELRLRQQMADCYAALLEGVVCPALKEQATSSWAQYTLRLPEEVDRAPLCQQLAEADIPTAIYYPVPIHRQTPYAAYPVAAGGLPVTDRLSRQVLSLPMHPYLSEAEQTHIADQLNRAVRKG
jgi:dTDP-4-amino-4,6-dideoxygalactose transaminase